MKNILLLIAFFFSFNCFSQQKFVPDAYGHVDDPAFLKFMKEKGYQLVGGFAPVDKDSTVYYARVVKDDKWGFINTAGIEVIAPQYNGAVDFKGGSAQVFIKKPVAGEDYHVFIHRIIDAAGNNLGEYDFVSRLDSGFYAVTQSGKSGIINTHGKVVVPLEYKGSYIAERYFYMGKDNKRAVFEYTGKQLTDFIYTELRDVDGVLRGFDGDKFCVLDSVTAQPVNSDWYYENPFYVTHDANAIGLQNDKGYCLINKQGQVISGYYLSAVNHWLNVISVTKESGTGLLNSTGKEVIACVYSRIGISEDGKMFTAYKKDGSIVYFNNEYKPVDFSAYEKVEKIENGFAVVRTKGKLGFADYTGKLVIPAKYDYCDGGFDANGIAAVTLNDKHALIDRTGKALTPFVDAYIIFFGGFYNVPLDNGIMTLYNKQGVKLPHEYQYITFIKESNGLFCAKKNGQYGVVDMQNRLVVPFAYTYVYERLYANGLLRVKMGDKIGFVNLKGKPVVPVAYDDESNEPEMASAIIAMYEEGSNFYVDLYGNKVLVSH